MEAIGGHIARKNNKADHKNLGLGLSSNLVRTSSEPVDTSSNPVEENKSTAKAKKPTGEKVGRTTTNIDEASLIVVSPKEFKTSSFLLW